MLRRYFDRVADFRNDVFYPAPLYLALILALFNANDYKG